MGEKPNPFAVAARHPVHGVLLLIGSVAAVAGLFHGSFWPVAAFAAAETFYLLVVPVLPPFRAWVDRTHAQEMAHRKTVDLERIASKLSPNAKSRLDGISRVRAKILDAMRTMNAPDSMTRDWRVRLDELRSAALRILVAIDTNRADAREERMLASEIRDLETEVSARGDGPAKAAKVQRLALLKKRAGAAGLVGEQREAAITQLETLEDMLKEILDQALAGRDSESFGRRLESLSAQVEAVRETVSALDQHAETVSELAVFKAGRS